MVISKDCGNFDSPIKQTQTSLMSSQKQRNKSCFGTLLMLFALNYAALKITIIPKWVLRDLVRFRSQPLVVNFINILRAAFYTVIREKLRKSLCSKNIVFKCWWKWHLFTNILQTAFEPIFFCLKTTKPNGS